ncbi:MAG: FHA domain-containing protein, partial [Bacillaceae bacterium]
ISSFLYYQLDNPTLLQQQNIQVGIQSQYCVLLPMNVIQKGETVYLRYDLLSEYTLADLLKGKQTQQSITQLLCSIVDMFIKIEELGLYPQSLVLNKEHIYINTITNQLQFVYVPVDSVEKSNDFADFLREILSYTQFDESENSQFFIKLHNYIAALTNELPEDVFAYLENEVGVKMSRESSFYNMNKVEKTVHDIKITSNVNGQSVEKQHVQKIEVREVQYKEAPKEAIKSNKVTASSMSSYTNQTFNQSKPSVVQAEDDCGTTVLGVTGSFEDVDEGTTVLNIQTMSRNNSYLIIKKSGERVQINKDSFKIGRDQGYADFVCKNPVVGRVHGTILTISGNYYLEDNQSKNGSYLNGNKLARGERVKLNHEDLIKFGNEELLFCLY